jgi:hypothetical protein
VDARTRRIGENEALFREVNERVRDLDETLELVLDKRSLVCECGNETCIEQITMTAKEYEEVRADPAQFAIAPGHQMPDVEDVVREGRGFHVVRKHRGAASALAEEHDPRSQ